MPLNRRRDEQIQTHRATSLIHFQAFSHSIATSGSHPAHVAGGLQGKYDNANGIAGITLITTDDGCSHIDHKARKEVFMLKHLVSKRFSWRRVLMPCAFLTMVVPVSAFGQTDSWLGGAGIWSDSTKWSAGVPGSTSNVFIDHGVAGASSVTLNYNGAQCANLTIDNDDSLTMVDGTIFTLFGPAVTNAGNVLLNSAGFGTYFNFNGAVTLGGTGTLTMSNNSANHLMGYAQPSSASVTNNSTIQGAGGIGWNGGLGAGNSFTNNGTINANQTTPLTLGVGSGTFTNTGMLEATKGGTLVITGAGALTNTGGTIHADPASIVSLASGATILGGTLTTSGTGTIQANCCFNGGTLNGVTINGTFQLNTNNGEFLAGTITNNGSIQINDKNNFGTYMDVTGAVTLKGTGTLTMSNDSANYIMGYAQGAGSLTNQSTIQGAGNFGFTGGIGAGNSVINQGTIFANQKTSLFINVNSGTFTNTGTLKVKAGSVMYIGGPGFTNFSGTTLTGGKYLVTGTLQFDNANIVTNSASITLTGLNSRIINQSAVNGLANVASNTKTGALTLTSSKTLATPGNFSNAGKVTVGVGTTLQIGTAPNGTYTQTAGGTTTVDGTLVAPTGVNIQAGSLLGKGTINASVISSGSVTAGDSATLPGTLSPSTYTQNSAGSLTIPITSDTTFGRLAVANGVSLKNGPLKVMRLSTYIPAIGKTFIVLTGSVVTGTFSNSTVSINSGEHFAISYNPTNVTLTVESGP